MCDDFNEVTNALEKIGGQTIDNRRVANILDCINNLNMIDLGFAGYGFTLTNMSRNNTRIIMEILDRFLCIPL